MKIHTIKNNRRLIAAALLAFISCIALFFGLFGLPIAADGEEPFASITAELNVETVYDDYDLETIKKDLKVYGVSADGSKSVITSGYTVEFANGKLTAGAEDNAVMVKYQGLSFTLPVETVEAATAELRIGAISGYERSNAYFVNSEGFYAFVQGMTAEQVESRLAVELVYPNHTELLPYDGTKVKWTSSAPSFGNDTNASDISVNISLSVSGIDGVEDSSVSESIVFAASKRFALKVRDGWVQPSELLPSTTVASFIKSLQGNVFVIMNSGFEGGAVNVESELSYSGLFVGATADALKTCKEGDKFPKTLEIPYNGDGVKALQLELEVTYNGYAGFERRLGGVLPIQIARSEKLDYGDVYAEALFDDGYGGEIGAKIYLKDVPESDVVATFYDKDNNQLDSLTRSVERINLVYTAPDGSKVTGNFSGVQVSPISIARPSIEDKELIYSTENCSTVISGLVTDDVYGDNMKVETDSAYAKYEDGVISFERGGTYKITVSFLKGENSDFIFMTGAGDGEVDASNPTRVTYTVNVLKAPIVVTLDNFKSEIQFGEREPSYTVRGAVEGNASMQFIATNKIDTDNLPYEDKTTAAPSYRLYYIGTDYENNAYASYDFPQERGSYKVYVSTAETAWYDKGELETPFEFEIVQRKISLGNASIKSVTFDLGTEYGEDDVVKQVTATGFAPQHQDNPAEVVSVKFSGANAGKTVTHAGNYGVIVTIINSNYKWSDTESTDKTTNFTINKAQLYFNASQGSFTYGDIKSEASLDVSGLRGWAMLGAPTYEKDGSAYTVPSNGIWQAGEYKAVYKIGSYADGVLATDVTCETVQTSFTVARREIVKVEVDTSNSGNEYKNEAWAFALNNYLQGEQTLANGAVYSYGDILNIKTSGLLTDGITKITTISFDAEKGVIYVTDAGEYTFEISIKDSNFTWKNEGSTPQTVTASATILQRELSFKLNPETDLTYTGENQVPETEVDWQLGENLTVTLTCEYSRADGSSIDKTDIIDAGGYKVTVTGFVVKEKPNGASYTYAVNYKLPDDSSLGFNIKTPYLIKPVLKGGRAEADYQGKNNPFDFLDFIEGDTYTYTANGETKCSLKFTYEKDSQTFAELALAGTYTVTVIPAENFKWKGSDGGDGGADALTFTFLINRLAVVLEWTESSLSSVYGETPAPEVIVNNAVTEDTVGIVIGYKDKNGANTIANLTSNSNAGYYTVYASDLDGADKDNYVLDDSAVNANLSERYTILKKQLAQPAQPSGATESAYSGSLWSGSIGGFKDYNLTSALVGTQITGVRPADWYTQSAEDADRVIDTSSSERYSFNVSNGDFTCFDAGYYSVEFTIKDSANYCWENSGNTRDFDFEGVYTHKWNEFAKLERKTLTAPALGSNRAMEWGTVTALNTILTGALDGINYGVLYGTNKETDNITGTTQGEVDGFDGATATRGQYFALLTINSDALNYVWNVEFDNDDKTGYAGASFVNGGKVFEIIYTSENGAQVKLYYAITASQVNVKLTINDYVYGDNGAFIGNTANPARMSLNDAVVLEIPEGFEDATFDGSGGGGAVYTFYNEDGTELGADELVNGLPWNAGEYGVRIVIIFDRNDAGEEVYSEWDSGKQKITVNTRGLEIVWSYAGKTGDTLETVYNGAGQMPTAQIENMPSKEDFGDVDSPLLTYNYSDTEKPENANSYTVSVIKAEGGNFNLDKTSDCSFTISKYNLSIEAEGVNGHVYGEEIAVSDKWTYGGSGKFYNNDADNIKLVVLLNGVGDPFTSNVTPIGTYKLCPVWNNYSTLTLDENGEYTLETANYIISVKSADFTVVKRLITVEFTADGASGTYGETADLYQSGVYTLSTENGTGDPLADDVYDVFRLSAKLNSVEAVGDSKNWSIGIYTVTGTAISDNYGITFVGSGKYEIISAEIMDVNVTGYVGTYDASAHDLFTVSAVTVNNQSLKWYYKSIGSVDWLPYFADGKNAQIKDVADSGVYFVKATAPNHKAVVFSVGGKEAEVPVTVEKAEIKVQINIGIWYGEENPADLSFKADVDSLISDADTFKFDGLKGNETIANINVSGTFAYSADYTQGEKQGIYSIKFINDSDTLNAPNYNFVNAVKEDGRDKGVLTVKPLALKVVINDIESVYYDTFSKVKFVTEITLPDSTYTGIELTQSELAENIWEEIFDASAGFEGANLITLKTTAFADMNAGTHTQAVGIYSISGTLNKDKTDYTAIFSGSNGSTAIHKVVPANLSVSDITGYKGGYDELSHLALIIMRNGEVSEVFATANDGTNVTVSFYASDYSDNAVSAEDLDWSGLPVVTDPIEYIDVCRKNVYYRIFAGGNYETVYGMCETEISRVENAFVNESDLKFNGWTYGLYSATNLNGYNADTTHKVTEPVSKFTRLVLSDGEVGQNEFAFDLTRDGKPIAELSGTHDTITSIFAEMWEKGLFSAGEYSLTINMDGTVNYGSLEKSFVFTVYKKTLTVTADDKSVVYGGAAPEYSYSVSGFVAGKTDGVVDTEADILGTENNFFTSDYSAGRLSGSVGTYAIKHYQADGSTVIEGLTDKVLENYSFRFESGELTVEKREITITITDAENFYNLSVINGETYGKEEIAEWRNCFTVSGVYEGDTDGGIQKIFALRTNALTSAGGKDTNEAGEYPIYAKWLDFLSDSGAEISFGHNYSAVFADCSYRGELPDDAVIQDGNNYCAGTYTIKKAFLAVDIRGPFNNADGTQEAVNGSVFSNTKKYYKAFVTNDTDIVDFVVTYYNGTVISAENRLTDAPVNVGKYSVTATTDNKNYVANRASIPFDITPATLNVGWVVNGTYAAEIQYGENIPEFDVGINGYPANNRFSGLTYKFSSPHFTELSETQLIELLGEVEYGYETAYDDATERDIYIAPKVKVSQNFTASATREILRVVSRKITVQVDGYDEGNATATSHYTGKDPFADNKGEINDWLTVIENDAFVHGHGLADLGITLTIESQNYNASDTPYNVNVLKGNSPVSRNYNVVFVVGEEKIPYSEVKPTYLITQKEITVTAKNVNVIYGDAIDSNVSNGILQSNLSLDLFNRYFTVSGFENGETYMSLSDSAMQENSFVFSTGYMPYLSRVGNEIVLSIDGSSLGFTNYKVTKFVSGKVIVTPRVITAGTHDEIYLEATDADGNKIYNNGVYGASRNAVIEFIGHDNGIGYDATRFAPKFSVSYNTKSGVGQTAQAAPTKVGEYIVTVNLTNGDYVFAGNAVSTALQFNVLKRTMSPSWLHTAIANNPEEGETVDLTNKIADYVESLMTLSNFQKTVGDSVFGITEGTGPDRYQIGTVGGERVGLHITAQGTGEYRVTFAFTSEASANYQWNDSDSASEVTVIFNVTTNKVYITGLRITGWIYKQYDAGLNKVIFSVSNGNTDGVQISYAPITGQIPTDTAGFQSLSYSASIPEAAGNYAVRAYYPSYQGLGGDEQFTSFTITKATVSAPVITVSGNNGVYGGVQLNSSVVFDPMILRISGFNGTNYVLTETGATLSAVNAGTYTVRFAIIDSANYQWGGNVSSADWVIGKAEDNVVTWNNTEEQRTVIYGNVFVPDASATYGGTVYYRYMLKTGDTVPDADDSGWTAAFNKFNVGEYWIKATNSGNSNYNGDFKIISFKVVKATLTVTPNGSMIYGNEFENSNPTFQYTVTEGLVRGDDPNEVIKAVSEVTYSVTGSHNGFNAGTYGFVLETDENGNVIGLAADNYKIVSGVGVFTVNKRSVVVNIGNKTSQYGRPVDVSDVSVTYGSQNGLVAGDDLNLTFTTMATGISGKGGYIINATYNNGNYNATINPGTYTITERLITVEIVQGGGVYGENIVGVTYSKVLDDEQVDITDFVNDKLNITVVYSGTANDGTVFNGTQTPLLAGSYVATVKGSGNDNFIVVGEPFAQFVVEKKEVDGSLITVENQTYNGEIKIPEINNSAFVSAYGGGIYEELAHGSFVNAGEHNITLRLIDADNYKWLSVEIAERNIIFTIDKAENELTEELKISGWIYGEYDVATNSPSASVKFGQSLIVYTYCETEDGRYYSGAPITGNVGDYYVRATVMATDNYNAFESAPVKFSITKKSLALPALAEIKEGEGKNDVYSGGELLAEILGFDMALMNLDYEGKTNVSGGRITLVAVNAGTYTVKLTIAGNNNYRWQNTEADEVILSWTVAPKAVAKPIANTNRFMVNGQYLTYIPEGFDDEIMFIEGNRTAYGGEFKVTVGLKDKANYVWEDGGAGDITFDWKVSGINTVFKIVVSVLSGVCGIAILAAGVQLLIDRRRKRILERDIDERSQAETNAQAQERGNE